MVVPAVVFAAAGCAGGLDPGVSQTPACVPNGGTTTPPATFATVKDVLKGGGPTGAIDSCVSAPCHDLNGAAPPPPRMNLVLRDDANLYHTMTTYISTGCGGVPLVNPGKPDQSALIMVLNGTCMNTFRMPLACTDEHCWDAGTIAALSQWIANCAPEN
jgi:hypothetical protein